MERFGDYVLLEKIGSGGMAEVFQAVQIGVLGVERIVALKRMHPALSEDEKFVRMFLREGKIVLQLHHPNIVTTYDFGEVDGTYYMAMEFISGWDLKRLMKIVSERGEIFPLSASLYIIQSVLRALDYAHSLTDVGGRRLNLVHRDISPGNIMISVDGVVKLSDFGVARAGLSDNFTLGGSIVGKISYMPPEMVAGKPVDRRGDIFSVGIILLELLTGERVFEGGDFEIMRKIRSGYAEGLIEKRNFPDTLKRILIRAVATEPSMRYSTAEEFLGDVNEFVFHHLYQNVEDEFKKFIEKFEPALRPLPFNEREILQFFSRGEEGRTRGRRKLNFALPLLLLVLFAGGYISYRSFFPFRPVEEKKIMDKPAGRSITPPQGKGERKKENRKVFKRMEKRGRVASVKKWRRMSGRKKLPPPLKPEKVETEREKVKVAIPMKRERFPSPGTSASSSKVVKRYGYFTILTDPWARVYIDGREMGSTPIFRVKLEEGKHRVKLIFPDTGLIRDFEVNIEGDREVRKVLKMEGEK